MLLVILVIDVAVSVATVVNYCDSYGSCAVFVVMLVIIAIVVKIVIIMTDVIVMIFV